MSFGRKVRGSTLTSSRGPTNVDARAPGVALTSGLLVGNGPGARVAVTITTGRCVRVGVADGVLAPAAMAVRVGTVVSVAMAVRVGTVVSVAMLVLVAVSVAVEPPTPEVGGTTVPVGDTVDVTVATQLERGVPVVVVAVAVAPAAAAPEILTRGAKPGTATCGATPARRNGMRVGVLTGVLVAVACPGNGMRVGVFVAVLVFVGVLVFVAVPVAVLVLVAVPVGMTVGLDAVVATEVRVAFTTPVAGGGQPDATLGVAVGGNGTPTSEAVAPMQPCNVAGAVARPLASTVKFTEQLRFTAPDCPARGWPALTHT